jgi:hypothetical protein
MKLSLLPVLSTNYKRSVPHPSQHLAKGGIYNLNPPYLLLPSLLPASPTNNLPSGSAGLQPCEKCRAEGGSEDAAVTTGLSPLLLPLPLTH